MGGASIKFKSAKVIKSCLICLGMTYRQNLSKLDRSSKLGIKSKTLTQFVKKAKWICPMCPNYFFTLNYFRINVTFKIDSNSSKNLKFLNSRIIL